MSSLHPWRYGEARDRARRRLPRFLFDYIDGGAGDETTQAANVEDLAKISLPQRVLTGVSNPKLETTLLGQTWRLPFGFGPVGLAGMYRRRGERGAAAAARKAGIPFCLSTVSVCTIRETVEVGGPVWFQLYMMRDRGFMADLLAQAAAEGCETLVFTVDMPTPGLRYRDYKSGLTGAGAFAGAIDRLLQAAQRPAWSWDVGLCGRPHTLGNVTPVLGGRTGLEDFMRWMAANFDPSVTWSDLDWVRSRWKGTLILKGILHPEDAILAERIGANALVISNHGGRQLDGATSTSRALPRIADAVGGAIPLLVDGGVRSGVDVVRLVHHGARFVLLGRAWAYALASGGELELRMLTETFEREIRTTMILSGLSGSSRI